MPKGQADFKVKKSLNFEEPRNHNSRPNSSQANHVLTADETRKRQQDEMFGSLSDDEDLCSKGNHHCSLKNESCMIFFLLRF